jgi:hypothetical protein
LFVRVTGAVIINSMKTRHKEMIMPKENVQICIECTDNKRMEVCKNCEKMKGDADAK